MKKLLSLLSLLLLSATTALAEGTKTAAAGQAGGTSSMLTTILYFVVIIGIFYFLLIRPQKKKEKEAQAMIEAIKKGDKVTTIGGFHGKVLSIKNGIILLQLGDNKVKIDSWAIKTVDKASSKPQEQIEEPEELESTDEIIEDLNDNQE